MSPNFIVHVHTYFRFTICVPCSLWQKAPTTLSGNGRRDLFVKFKIVVFHAVPIVNGDSEIGAQKSIYLDYPVLCMGSRKKIFFLMVTKKGFFFVAASLMKE